MPPLYPAAIPHTCPPLVTAEARPRRDVAGLVDRAAAAS
ncbi:hypothetical protein EDC02_5462 [Micromonospora sp. Llam0]|nr:hypothetical protein EDC02_5462 [Micromonospora sp. Llam0]